MLSEPRHVAIIMDGNGRWARARGRPRAFGHREGVQAVRRAVRAAGDLGVEWLTLFGFSTENWTRPRDEVNALFDLLRRYVDADLEELAEAGVRVRVIGERDTLTDELRSIIERAEARTIDNDKFNLTIAFNYGGRGEIARAVRRLAEAVKKGEIAPEAVDEAAVAGYLDTAGLPDPDLVIRTSGERRLSNFLIWQAAYAELVFLDLYWPDFDHAALEAALAEYRSRERRFGGVARVDAE